MFFSQLLADGSRYAQTALHSPMEMLGLLAALAAGGLVLVSTFVKTMIPLRWLAIGSNLGFIGFGAVHPSYPMLLLHLTLLPINLSRLREMIRLTRRVRAAATDGELSGVWLKPYMRSARLSAGTILFKQGDRGDRLYLLADGRIELVEIGADIAPGEIFGEIAFFAPDRRRRLTARCTEACTVLSIDESTMKQLYYQNPAFGFKMIELVAGRLSADVWRLSEQLRAAGADRPSLAAD